jgi:hypothetical protein
VRKRILLTALGLCLVTGCTGVGSHLPSVATVAKPLPSSALPHASPGAVADPELSAVHSSVHGVLPSGAITEVAGIPVPLGSPITPEEPEAGADPAAEIWVSSSVLPDAGPLAQRFVEKFASTGLWPVVLADSNDPNDDFNGGDWLPERIGGTGSAPGGTAESAFINWWNGNIANEDTVDRAAAAAFGRSFPGLGAPQGPIDRSAITSYLTHRSGRLALIPVTRPADAIARIGWLGATNYLTPAELSTALRSWEDRYGAEVVGFGSDYLDLAVRNPPRSYPDALVAAAEQFAVCPDNLSQNADDDTPDEYATSLVGTTTWECWWD